MTEEEKAKLFEEFRQATWEYIHENMTDAEFESKTPSEHRTTFLKERISESRLLGLHDEADVLEGQLP